jgi:hypothetical protein
LPAVCGLQHDSLGSILRKAYDVVLPLAVEVEVSGTDLPRYGVGADIC